MKKNLGARHARALILCCLTVVVLAACSPDGRRNGPQPILVATVDQLPDSSAAQAAVMYLRPNDPVPLMDDSAVVVVNGVALEPGLLCYAATVPPVTAGAGVDLHFAFEEVDLARTLAMPAKPVITTASGTFSVSSPLAVTWGAVTPVPDNIIVRASWMDTVSGDFYDLELPGTATSGTIPAGTLLSGQTGLPVIVEAVNTEQALDSYGLDVYVYQVGNEAEVDINTIP